MINPVNLDNKKAWTNSLSREDKESSSVDIVTLR